MLSTFSGSSRSRRVHNPPARNLGGVCGCGAIWPVVPGGQQQQQGVSQLLVPCGVTGHVNFGRDGCRVKNSHAILSWQRHAGRKTCQRTVSVSPQHRHAPRVLLPAEPVGPVIDHKGAVKVVPTTGLLAVFKALVSSRSVCQRFGVILVPAVFLRVKVVRGGKCSERGATCSIRSCLAFGLSESCDGCRASCHVKTSLFCCCSSLHRLQPTTPQLLTPPR